MSEFASDILAPPRRLFERIGNPLEWSEVDKCMLGAALSLPFSIGYFLLGLYLPHRPQIAPFLDLKFLRYGNYCVAGGNVVWWTATLLLCLWLRKRRDRVGFLTHATCQVYLLSNVFFAYAFGTVTSLMGIILVGMIIISFLFFGRQPTYWGIATSGTSFYGTMLAAHWHLLPYAPVLRLSPYEPSGTPSAWWFALNGGVALCVSCVVFILFDYAITRWRDREVKLAVAYRDLSETKDQLVRSESLAAVGSLVTGAAHELRNPLGSSGALLQSLRDEIANSDASGAQKTGALGTIEMALAGQRRAAAIVERLYSLTDSLAHVGAMRPVGEVLEGLKSRYPTVEFEILPLPQGEGWGEGEGAPPPSPGPSARPLPLGEAKRSAVLVNERALTTILSNLLDNAIAAGGEGPVRLSVGLTGAGAAVPSPPRPPSPNRLGEGGAEPAEPGEAGERDSLLFTISDTGCGIAKDKQSEIFQPFFTGEKTGAGHGVGLGLYVVYELVTRMGGTVELESEVGRGTRARVRVPVETDVEVIG